MNRKKAFALPYIVWMIVFTIVPLLLILFYAFIHKTDTGALIFTTEYIRSALSGSSMSVLRRSFCGSSGRASAASSICCSCSPCG